MRQALHGALGGLVVGIIAGALPLHASGRLSAPQLKAIKAQEPQRASMALAHARALASQLGFQTGESFAVKSAFTSPEGRTVVRLNQTSGGYRVYGASTLGHVEANGQTKLVATAGLRPSAVPAGTPALSAEQAKAIALKHAALKGKPFPPAVEQVVFPTAFVDGLRLVFDAAAKKMVIDRESTVLSRRTEPFVWAYQVDVFTKNREDGITDMQYVIDAQTGALLRKITNLRYQAAPVAVKGTPAKGVGMGQYVGQVSIDTTAVVDDAGAPTGTFALVDQTRGTLPNPFMLQMNDLNVTGLTTLYEDHNDPMYFGSYFYTANTTNQWGDGMPFQDWPNEGLRNGETAAIDAHYGIGLTWDLYKNIFGRNGIDDQGTTPFLQVHTRDPLTGRKWDNAMWSSRMFGMVFGDGSYLPDTLFAGYTENGLPLPGNPSGMMSLTQLDIAGHELSHGLTFGTADLIYRGESGGLNESISDIMGTLVEAYHYRTQDDLIPNVGNDWKLGPQCRPMGPLRYMDTPSKDGLSADNWYEGLDWMEVHYNSGPLNRFFYYLSAGAPAASRAETWSPYLPAGSDGIGNDKAARIVYKALSEYMVPSTNYHQAGEALVHAATDLYPGGPEVTSVKKALTAINVQVAGEPLLTRVSFASNNGGVLSSGFEGGEFLTKAVIVPLGATLAVKATVANCADPSFTLKLGGHRAMIDAPGEADPTGLGVVNGDGTWTAPLRAGAILLTAASKAKPEQYTEGLVFVQDLDTDADGDQDAIDMGATAFSWFLGQSLMPSHSPYGGYWVDDLDVDLFQTAIKNAWGVK